MPAAMRGPPVAQALHEHRKGLGGDEGRQHIDQGDRGILVGVGQRLDGGLDGPLTQSLELGDGFQGLLAQGLVGRLDLGDQPVGTQVREKAHYFICGDGLGEPADYAI